MRIELLYFDGCPSREQLQPRLEQLVREAGVRDPIELRQIESPEAAEAERFLGSPTVRVDGEDIDPAALRSAPTMDSRAAATGRSAGRAEFPRKA